MPVVTFLGVKMNFRIEALSVLNRYHQLLLFFYLNYVFMLTHSQYLFAYLL